MSDIVMLQGHESETVLQAVVQSQSPAIMSYLSKDKWHVAKVVMKELTSNRIHVEGCHASGKLHPVNIRIGQPVGVNFKHAYGKFVFDTTVVGLEPSSNPGAGGTIVLDMPERIGVVQRRSYFRVNVPSSLKVAVVLWHRTGKRSSRDGTRTYYEGRLVDISAGGAQVTVPLKRGVGDEAGAARESDLRKGQFMSVRFTPMPYETPLMFSAQIRSVLPTADRAELCVGLQIVGLEASEEGRQTLSRLANVVEHYHQVNQSGGREQYAKAAAPPSSAPLHIPAGALQ